MGNSAASAAEQNATDLQLSITMLQIEARKVETQARDLEGSIKAAARTGNKPLCKTLILQQLQMEKSHHRLQRSITNMQRMKANAESTRVTAIQEQHMQRAVRSMRSQAFDPLRAANTTREYEALMSRMTLTGELLDDARVDASEEGDELGQGEEEQAEAIFNRFSAIVGVEEASKLFDAPTRRPAAATTTMELTEEEERELAAAFRDIERREENGTVRGG